MMPRNKGCQNHFGSVTTCWSLKNSCRYARTSFVSGDTGDPKLTNKSPRFCVVIISSPIQTTSNFVNLLNKLLAPILKASLPNYNLNSPWRCLFESFLTYPSHSTGMLSTIKVYRGGTWSSWPNLKSSWIFLIKHTRTQLSTAITALTAICGSTADQMRWRLNTY